MGEVCEVCSTVGMVRPPERLNRLDLQAKWWHERKPKSKAGLAKQQNDNQASYPKSKYLGTTAHLDHFHYIIIHVVVTREVRTPCIGPNPLPMRAKIYPKRDPATDAPGSVPLLAMLARRFSRAAPETTSERWSWCLTRLTLWTEGPPFFLRWVSAV
jgi:hypothetical protein